MNKESRYSKGTTAWVEHPIEGRVQVVHTAPIQWTNYPYSKFSPSEADSLTTMAWRTYGRAQDYWFIASMNPQVECPDDIVPGDTLRIPAMKLW